MSGFVIFPKVGEFIEINNVSFAISTEEQKKGLMNVIEPSFMVFLYKKACSPVFWMKNTYLPLDIIFCLNNTIKNIKHGKPLNEKLIKNGNVSDYIIEAPHGFCINNNININDKIKLKYDKSILDKILNTWS